MSDAVSPVRPEDEKAVRDIVARITGAWNENNADELSTVYSEDASIVLPGAHLKGRPAIRDWMAEAFDGKWKGTHVLGAPLELRYIRDDVMLLLSQGGAYPPGATEVPVEHAIRGIWVFVKQDGEWTITGYGNTPVRAPIPLPDGPR
ncbi:SgcJ/EcaC family oxidoreductase [Plantactinospora veratri]|uniref:SgcJ/EcaC family oxidoreductase n=1 Tax=Plantactinospora veratri TaxID=1436122 RepID=A0ABU7SAQ2_9ACTN